MERTNLNTMHEQALVVGLMSTGDKSWQAVLMTRNGVEYVSSDLELRGDFDWRPRGWVHDRQSNCFVPPGIHWDEEAGEYSGEIDQAALAHAGEVQRVGGQLAPKLPVPRQGEKYPTWKSRVYRSMPELKEDLRTPILLAETWQAATA
jgi:hypothetical protein|tara:strand:- start:3192 stop:3635 length:444 start_codon:yes stop_codon:yes gene_type:complete